MGDIPQQDERPLEPAAHASWVRVSHWLMATGVLISAFTGLVILLVHPRLYWGEAGNGLTEALIELPIGRNHRHGGWDAPVAFYDDGGPVSAARTVSLFNQNGWARSLHFIGGWCVTLVGAAYLFLGLRRGHFRAHLWPTRRDLAASALWRDVVNHVRLRIPQGSGGPSYGVLQKCAYSLVTFVAFPLLVVTGIAMSPAVTAAVPALGELFGGFQSARTIHFFTTAVVLSFIAVHVALVAKSGLRRQLRAMIWGD